MLAGIVRLAKDTLEKGNLMDTSDGNGPILLVEDHPGIRTILRMAFEHAGFQTTEATTGQQALDALAEPCVEAVVLDPGLPDGLGRAVVERLQMLASRRDGPVWVVLSASDLEEAKRRYGVSRANFVRKPFDPHNLVSALKDMMANRRQEGGAFDG